MKQELIVELEEIAYRSWTTLDEVQSGCKDPEVQRARELIVARLRNKGLDWPTIASTMGMTRAGVWKIAQRAGIQ